MTQLENAGMQVLTEHPSEIYQTPYVSGRLHFTGKPVITPLIQILFGATYHLETNVDPKGVTNHFLEFEYVFDPQTNVPLWDIIKTQLIEHFLDETISIGEQANINEVIHLILVNRQSDDVGIKMYVEPIELEQGLRPRLSTLFQIAHDLNDGHNLQFIESEGIESIETLLPHASYRFGTIKLFGGQAQVIGKELSLAFGTSAFRDSTSQLLAAVDNRDTVLAAQVLLDDLLVKLHAIRSNDVRDAIWHQLQSHFRP